MVPSVLPSFSSGSYNAAAGPTRRELDSTGKRAEPVPPILCRLSGIPIRDSRVGGAGLYAKTRSRAPQTGPLRRIPRLAPRESLGQRRRSEGAPRAVFHAGSSLFSRPGPASRPFPSPPPIHSPHSAHVFSSQSPSLITATFSRAANPGVVQPALAMPMTSSEPKKGVEEPNGANGFDEPSPFVQPGVPEKRLHTATVYYLDATHNDFHIHKNSEGQDLFDMVANQLRIVERDYFALSFSNEKTSEREWLYNDQRISKQVAGRQWEFTFEFKFYPPEPSSLVDDLARRHLVLQCRRDVCSGRIPTSFATQALLASYLAQAELGDFAPSEQYVEYLRSANVAPSVDDKLIAKIQELHHQHRGQTPSEAELNYLNTCKKLNMYGIYAFEGKDKSSPVTVGIGAHGVNIYKDNVRLHRFPWQNIDKISYKNSHFTVKLKPETVEKGSDRYSSTRLPDYQSAKKAWKTAVEHHTFFRLIQPETKPRKSLFRWNSQRFRYQGRTQFQTKMASQMFDHHSGRPNETTRGVSRSVDDIATHATGPVAASPVRYVDDRTETKSPLSSPDQSYVVSSATEEAKGKRKSKKDAEEVGVRVFASSVPVSTAAENLHASSSSSPAPPTATTACSAPLHDLQPFLREQELDGAPIAATVSIYNKGFYDGHVKNPSKTSWLFWRRAKATPELRHLNGASALHADATSRSEDLPTYPLRYFAAVYHSGGSQRPVPNRRFEVFEREAHAGSEDIVEKAALNLDNYLFAKTSREDDARLDRSAEVDPLPLRATTLVYHSGRPPHVHRAPKRPMPQGIATGYVEDDTTSEYSWPAEDEVAPKKTAVLHLKKPARRRRTFGFWHSKDSEVLHDTEPSTSRGFPIAREPFAGPLHDTWRAAEFVPNPLRDDVNVYHSGRSRAPLGNRKKSVKFDRERHGGLEDEVAKEHVDQEGYPEQAYRGHLDETARRRDMETLPIKEFSTIYHPGYSRKRPRRKRGDISESESSAESVEDEEFVAPGRRGTNFFKFLKSHRREYPEKTVYAGEVSSTARRWDLEEDPLRYHVAVYHSGYSSMPYRISRSHATHEGDEDVVQKDRLKKEFYPSEGLRYEGPLERTEKSEELRRSHLREFATAYHSGYSQEPPSRGFLKGRIFGMRSDSEDEVRRKKKANSPPKEGRFFGILRTPGKREPSATPSAFPPKGAKYAGPLQDTPRVRDIDAEPLRAKVAVYHSGYSLAPLGRTQFWRFERVTHPGEVEVVEKEKVQPESYRRSAEPFAGPLHSMERAFDLDTVPIRQHTRIYHPGYSGVKTKKSKAGGSKSDKESGFESEASATDSETKRCQKEKQPRKEEKQRRSGSFGFGFRMPAWKFGGKGADKDAAFPTRREPFEGLLEDMKRQEDLQIEPLRGKVEVYHSGSSVMPAWTLEKKKDRIFHPGQEEVVQKELVNPESYRIRAVKFTGPLEATHRERDVDTVPVREHARMYHPGQSCIVGERKREASSSEEDSFVERDRFEEKTPKEKTKREGEGRGKRSGSFGIKFPSWKLPSWERSPGKERKEEEPQKTPESLPQDDKKRPKKTEVEISETPKRPIVSKLKGATKTYRLEEEKKETTPPETFRRIAEEETELRRSPPKDGEDEEGRRASFRFGIKMPHWKLGGKHGEPEERRPYPISGRYSGLLEDTLRSAEFEGTPLRAYSKVYHSGYSVRPHSFFERWFHPGEEEDVEKEKIDIGAYKASRQPFEGTLEATHRGADLETAPLRRYAKVYHPGQSDAKVKKSKKKLKYVRESETSSSSEDELDDRRERSPSKYGRGFALNFKLPSWKRGGDPPEHPEEEETPKKAKKKKKYDVSLRVAHPGEVEEKEKVRPESYQRSAEPYMGPLEPMEKSTDLNTVPLTDHAKGYHPGQGHVKTKKTKRSRTTSADPKESSDDEGKSPKGRGHSFGLGFRMPAWKRGSSSKEREEPISDYPSPTKYSGSLEDTPKSRELEGDDLRSRVPVYHTGLYTRSHHEWYLFGRAKHPGEEEVVEKEKVQPESYQRSAEPFAGPLESTEKTADLDTVPIQDHTKVYHHGHSYTLKIGKKKKEAESSEESEDEGKTGESRSFGFKFPSWKRVVRASPQKEQPEEERIELTPKKAKKEKKKYDISLQVAHFEEVEVVEKEKVRPESYQRSAEPYMGTVDSTGRVSEMPSAPMEDHVKAYHSGQSFEKKKKGTEEDAFSSESASEAPKKTAAKSGRSRSFGLNFKLPKWKRGQKGEKEEPIPEYPTPTKYSGPMEDSTPTGELPPTPLRHQVNVYHSGHSVGPLANRDPQGFRIKLLPLKDEKENATPEAAQKKAEAELAPLEQLKREQKKKPMEETPSEGSEERKEGRASSKSRRSHSFGLNFKLPKWKRGSPSKEREEPISDYPSPTKYSGPLEDTSNSRELEGDDLRSRVPVYHTGLYTRPHHEWHLFGRSKHPGEEEVVEKEKVQPESYQRSAEPFAGPLESTEKTADLDTVPIQDHTKVYHHGHSYTLKIGKKKKEAESSEESEDEEKGGRSKSFGFKFPSWKRGERASPQKDYPASEKYLGPLEDTSKTRELSPQPLRDGVNVYHTGFSVKPGPWRFFGRLGHPGDEEVVARERIKTSAYPERTEPYAGALYSVDRNKDLRPAPILEHSKVYHSGYSFVLKAKKKRWTSSLTQDSDSSTDDERAMEERMISRDFEPSKSGRKPSFGLNFKLPSWRRGGDPPEHPEEEETPKKAKKEKKYDVSLRVAHPGEVEVVQKEKVRPESYQRSTEPYTGPVDSTGRENDLEDVPIERHSKVYHSYGKLKKIKKPKRAPVTDRKPEEETSSSEEDFEAQKQARTSSKSGRSHSFMLNFKLPKWKRGSPIKEREEPISDYPSPTKYSGPVEDTPKSRELERDDLRSRVPVYHTGLYTRSHREWHLFGRAKHPGEEEVVEKEKVQPESYQRSAEPFTGPLERTEKTADLDTVPIQDHVKVYHHGHFYTLKIGKKRAEVPESSEESADEDRGGRSKSFGFNFPSWKRGMKVEGKGPYADYPMSEKYTGALKDVEKERELPVEPLRSHIEVYHSGYSVRPHSFFERWFHPGEEEVVDKEKIDIGAYKASGQPFEGILEATHRGADLEAAPLRRYVKVYHPGESDAKVKKSKKSKAPEGVTSESETEAGKVRRSPSRYGRGFGFSFKLPSLSRQKGDSPNYPSTEKYGGPLEDTPKNRELPPAPLMENVDVHHSGKPRKAGDVFLRTSHPGEEEVVEKEKVQPESYQRSAEPFAGPLEETERNYDLPAAPLREFSSPYHPGFYTKQPRKWRLSGRSTSATSEDDHNRTVDSVDSVGSSSSRFGKLRFWRSPGAKGGSEPFHPAGFLTKQPPFRGPLERTPRVEELFGERIRADVAVYHSGQSEVPRANRKFPLFGRWRHEGEEEVVEKEAIEPQTYRRSAEPFVGRLEAVTKSAELEGVPLQHHAKVYHSGRSGAKNAKQQRRRRPSEAAESSSDEGERKRVGFHEEPVMVETKKAPKVEKKEVEVEKTKNVVIYVKSPKKKETEKSPKTEKEGLETPKAAKTKSPRRSGGLLGFWRSSEKKPAPKPTLSPSKPPYPSSGTYEGPLDNTSKWRDLEGVPLRSAADVYHSGQSQTPRSARLVHPGDVEIVEKANVDPKSYGRSTTPYEGSLHSTERNAELDTVALRETTTVYNEGHSYVKARKVHKRTASEASYTSAEDAPRAKRTQVERRVAETQKKAPVPKRSGRKRKFRRAAHPGSVEETKKEKVQPESYKRSLDPYMGPLDTVAKDVSFDTTPIGEHAYVYHAGRSDLKPKKAKKKSKKAKKKEKKKKQKEKRMRQKEKKSPSNGEGPSRHRIRLFSRDAPDQKEEVAERGAYDLAAYPSASLWKTPTLTALLTPSGDLPGAPIGEHAAMYHSGQSRRIDELAKVKPGFDFDAESASTSGVESDEESSPKKKQRRGIWRLWDIFRFVRKVDYTYPMITAPYRGPMDVVTLQKEIVVSPLELASEQALLGNLGAPSPFSLKVTEVTLNVFVQNERVSEYNCEVIVGSWPSGGPESARGAGLRGVLGREEARQAAEVDLVLVGGSQKDTKPASMESAPPGRSLFASIRHQLSQVTKKKEKAKKKEKKGVDVDSASTTSVDSTDVEVTHREIVVPSDDKENAATTNHEDKTTPSGPYVTATAADGVVVREEKLEEVYRIVGTGNTPSMDPSDMEGSLPHTTIQSWHETAVGPESVTTDVDEHGNIVKRTVKTQQVKHTVQRQTYQTFTVNEDEAGMGKIETSRQVITPVDGAVSPSKTPVVETHTRTVAYENPRADAPLDVPGEFVSSKTVTQGNRTVETITYKTEKDGVIETHVEHRVTIHSGSDIDHDAELSQAILEATNMNPDMTVERIEVKQESQC
ncbi:hypothetical protein QR680_009103 [Steinernema hermaphroditum]|uniref:Moesin/ezrin/radixin homolog 1 n=1 Tax=Steinernema hermaphroditum TaxID=289476 RepID=A0AA39M8U3_9BILA|nr:hypothetical protein QR680_009103 [Steinernema hermaphroditum]